MIENLSDAITLLEHACPYENPCDGEMGDCSFCNGYGHGRKVDGARHYKDCPWVAARIALGETPEDFDISWG